MTNALTIDRVIQRLRIGEEIPRPCGGLTPYQSHQRWFVGDDGAQGKQHHIKNWKQGVAFPQYFRIKSLDVYGPNIYVGGWGRIDGWEGGDNSGFKVAICHQDNGNNYLASWKKGGHINIIEEDRESMTPTAQPWGETLKSVSSVPPQVGKVFQFGFQIVNGILSARFDLNTLYVDMKSRGYFSGGGVGFRFDGARVSMGSLVVQESWLS